MNILVTAPFAEEDLAKLEAFGHVTYRPWKANGDKHTEQQLIDMLKETGARGLVVEHDPVSSTVIDAAELAWIGVCRGTPSNVDVAYATRKRIPVFTTPARNAQAVAEYVIGELICMLRKIPESRTWLLDRKWTGSSHESYLNFRGKELAGKKVGLVGLGGVGQRIAGLLKAFGCQIQYVDPYLTSAPIPEYIPVSMEVLFTTSDIVSVHLPVTEETIGSIDSSLLELMKPDAIFVNSARAAVVDRDSLHKVLIEGRIGGAILDVFYSEPPDDKDYELIQLPCVSATPHLAGNTFEVDRYHAVIMIDELARWTKKDQRISRN